jgi:Kef-type K+ transport system membrane component KefB
MSNSEPAVVVMDDQALVHLTVLVALFMISVCAAGFAARCVGFPALIAEVLVGMVWHSTHWLPDGTGPEGSLWGDYNFAHAFKIVGYVGLMVMVFDGGAHVDIQQVKKVGCRCVVLALAGCLVPVVSVWIPLVYVWGYDALEAFAVGLALASTAIGFALQLLNENSILMTPLGQLVTTAAMIDDVCSMILLGMLEPLSAMRQGEGNSLPVNDLVKPFYMSAAVFLACLGVRQVSIWLSSKILARGSETPKQEAHVSVPVPAKYAERKHVMIYCLFMMLAGVALLYCSNAIGSTYLLGAFMAGMIGTIWSDFQHAWDELCEPLLPWLSRSFFACSVGFTVPTQAMGNGDTGVIAFMAIMAILSKFLSTGALAARPSSPDYLPSFLQVGSAMVGRGELGFVQIQSAVSKGIVQQNMYGATVWALLLASALGPIMFRCSLKYNSRRQVEVIDKAANNDGNGSCEGSRSEPEFAGRADQDCCDLEKCDSEPSAGSDASTRSS